jgi:hypothetical protein
MTSPEGPSTGGGVQAMQHLRLLPPQPSMPTLVIGHLHQRDGTAELRTLDYVDAICRDRTKRGAMVDPGQYGQFLQSAEAFLAACGMRVTYSGPPADLMARLAAPTPSMAPAQGQTGLVVALVVTFLLALAGVVAWSTLKR